MLKLFTFTFILFLLTPPLAALEGGSVKALDPGEICETQSIMTLPWTLCLFDNEKTPGELRRALKMGFQEVHRIDEWMSEWKPKSLISQINEQAGISPVLVTDEAFATIQQSIHHSELTGGAWDITFNAFFGLYSWKKGSEKFPSDDEIKKILPLVNYKNIILDSSRKSVFLKNKGMKIGLGGMGEGWAVDKVFELLKPLKIKSGYIDASGAVRVWGVKPNNKLWVIAVGDPRPMNPDPQRSQFIYKMYATDIAVTTAGDTEKSFYRNGRLYHHIIDPKTGYSADQSIQVTCIGPTATICDFVDDGAFILGGEKGKSYAESQGTQVIMIDPKKHILMSKGLKVKTTAWGKAIQLRRNFF
jgi:thiamine biosynthesis lipoprotein